MSIGNRERREQRELTLEKLSDKNAGAPSKIDLGVRRWQEQRHSGWFDGRRW
jgi:hypothetical protein